MSNIDSSDMSGMSFNFPDDIHSRVVPASLVVNDLLALRAACTSCLSHLVDAYAIRSNC